MFELYQFNPETIKTSGFKLISTHETEQECHEKAALEGVLFYRIEEKQNSFSRKVFISELPKPPESEVIPEPETTPEPAPEVVEEGTQGEEVSS